MSSSGTSPERGAKRTSVSLITTIRNEADQLPELLESIRRQSLQPHEVIVVDGGSSDGSLAVLEEWKARLPLSVYQLQGANISEGRNFGIGKARSEIIAVTDAGVRLDPDWLQRLVAPLTQGLDPIDVVGGFFEPDSHTDFETALAATTLPDVEEIDPVSFLPSSRSVAFRRRWFEAGIQYPEWLDYCEDLIWDLRMQRAGARFAFQPRAIARFRPRSSARSFWWQYYRYARGDGKAGLFLRRHLARYFTYLVILPSFVISRSWGWRTVVLIGALGYMRRPACRLLRREGNSFGRLLPLLGMSAGLRAVGDVAKMTGYPAGLIWRARRYGLRKSWRSIPERSYCQKNLEESGPTSPRPRRE